MFGAEDALLGGDSFAQQFLGILIRLLRRQGSAQVTRRCQSVGMARAKGLAAITAIWKKHWLAWKPCGAECSSWPKASRVRATNLVKDKAGNPIRCSAGIKTETGNRPETVNSPDSSLARDNRDKDNRARDSRDRAGNQGRDKDKGKAASPRRMETAGKPGGMLLAMRLLAAADR